MVPVFASLAWLIGERPVDAAFALSWLGATLWRLFEDHVQGLLVPESFVRRRADQLQACQGAYALTWALLAEGEAEDRGRNLERILWFRVGQELRRRAMQHRPPQRRQVAPAPSAPTPPEPSQTILDSRTSPALYPSRLAGADPPQPGAE